MQGLSPDGKFEPGTVRKIVETLQSYADMLEPWAESVARYMLSDVETRNAKTWRQVNKEMGQTLRAEIKHAPTGELMQSLLNEQVDLIQSLPLEAAQRVHRLTTEALVTSQRADTIAAEILRTGEVTESRARLIARTEVARTSALLTQSRAQYSGSEGYVWRTAGDFDVRESHAEMEGKYVRWDTPPRLSDGTTTHAGCIYNCRCFAEPVLPDF